jgi:thiamine biosynthesis lipoprotein
MASIREKAGLAIAMGMIVVLFALGWWMHEETKLRYKEEGKLSEMGGASFKIRALVPQGKGDLAERAIAEALEAVRDLGARVNTRWEHSELSMFNQAAGGIETPMDPRLIEMLKKSRRYYTETGETFDVTILPILELYRRAEQTGHAPTDAELLDARGQSTWRDIRLFKQAAIKERSTAGIDLGGLAKGYAIDLACKIMRDEGIESGLVEIGGDVRCFGPSITGGDWIVDIIDPFARRGQNPDEPPKVLRSIRVRDKAVCTSGNWYRGWVINGRRYSETIDPRDPRRKLAKHFAASVTVIAPTATEADAWATALTVDPFGGLALLGDKDKPEIDAMIILPPAEEPEILTTPGFEGKYGLEPAEGDRDEQEDDEESSRPSTGASMARGVY